MISLESTKVCKNLSVDHRMFVCEIDRKNDPKRLKAARCMMDHHAAAFLDVRYCQNFKNKGGDSNV